METNENTSNESTQYVDIFCLIDEEKMIEAIMQGDTIFD